MTEGRKRRGRPPKVERHDQEIAVDPVSPQHVARVKELQEAEDAKESNKVIEKYYELRGQKLNLVRKKRNGIVYRTYIGKTKDPKVREQIERLKEEGRIKVRI